MPNPSQVYYSSPMLGVAVTLGNLAIWFGLASALTCVALYWTAMIRTLRARAAAPAAVAEEDAPLNGAAANGAANGTVKKNGARRAKMGQPAAPTPAELRTDRIALWARRFFYITSACVLLSALSLWTLIFGQHYSVSYVSRTSSVALGFGYRFASFWHDQEGTFLLWALYNVVIGSLLIWKARADERWVMPFFGLIHVSLFTLLTFMNPFEMIHAKDIRDLLEHAGASPEIMAFMPHTGWQHFLWNFGWAHYIHPKLFSGQGMNESLQNFWMVIHPPTLFVGFSTMVVPACFALAALMRRDYDGWVTRAAPWLTFSWSVLGTGVFLGAYWAYETLGWGGYWSWDPVENASLLPWLMGTTLIHGLLAQRNRGNFKQANLFIGVMTGSTVLLSSFLNRSGVLSEFSVHSFASPQTGVFWTLLLMLVLWTVMSIALWFWRYRDIQAEIAYEQVWERHFGFFLGLIVLSAISIVVTFGVTAPIWAPKMHMPLNIEYTFYNKALLPVLFVAVLLMTITPLMPWRRVREGPLRPFEMTVLALAGVFSLFFVFAAIWAWKGAFKTQNDPAYVGFGLILALALLINGVFLVRSARGGILQTGPWLAHIGFVLLLAGIVTTSRFNSVHPVMDLEAGESVTVLDRKFTFIGRREATANDRSRMLIDMEQNGKVVHLDPKYFMSRIKSDEAKPMAWPQILHEWWGGLWGDLYVEPSLNGAIRYSGVAQLQAKVGDPMPVVTTAARKRSDTPDHVALTLLDWTTPKDAAPGAPPAMTANVVVELNGVRQKVQARMEVGKEGFDPIPVRLNNRPGGTSYDLLFAKVDPATRIGTFMLVPEDPVQTGSFQVLHIPGIQVLWWGCYIMFAGGFLSYRRRALLARKPQPARAPAAAPTRRSQHGHTPEPAGAE